MVSVDDVLEVLMIDAPLDRALVQVAMAAVSEAAETSARRRVRWGLWDGLSPLAEAPGAGYVYLIYIDDGLSVVQSHLPGSPGFLPMSSSEATLQARAQAELIAEGLAFDEVVSRVRSILRSSGAVEG